MVQTRAASRKAAKPVQDRKRQQQVTTPMVAKTKASANTQVNGKAQEKSKTKAEPYVETKPKIKLEPKTTSESKLKAGPKIKAGPKPKPETEMKAKSTAPAKQRAKEVEGKEEKEEEHLCFRPAYIKFAAGEISWEEYLHHMLLHFVGRRHAGDELEQEYDVRCIGFYREDPFGYALLEFQRDEIHGSGYVRARHNPTEMNSAYRPRNVADLEAVFTAYANGTVANLRAKLAILPYATAENMQRAIALLALRDRKLDFLGFCLQLYAIDVWPSHAFMDAANSIDPNAESDLWAVIQGSEWRRSNPWRTPGRRDSRGQ